MSQIVFVGAGAGACPTGSSTSTLKDTGAAGCYTEFSAKDMFKTVADKCSDTPVRVESKNSGEPIVTSSLGRKGATGCFEPPPRTKRSSGTFTR